MNATISADIISSTSLSSSHLKMVTDKVRTLFRDIELELNKGNLVFWGRIVKGDAIECYIKEPHYALRIALLLKTTILNASANSGDIIGSEFFRKYGMRLAIGIGDMRVVDKSMDVMDGTAIYLSGRKIAEQATSGKQKIMIKRTMYFVSENSSQERQMNVYLAFVDQLLRMATPRQVQVLHQKLLGKTDKLVAKNLSLKSASTVNQHCTTFGWNAIESLLDYYEKEIYPL